MDFLVGRACVRVGNLCGVLPGWMAQGQVLNAIILNADVHTADVHNVDLVWVLTQQRGSLSQ